MGVLSERTTSYSRTRNATGLGSLLKEDTNTWGVARVPFGGGLFVSGAEPVDNVGFVLLIFIFCLINRQQWLNKIIPILRPERAQLQRKGWEVDFIKGHIWKWRRRHFTQFLCCEDCINWKCGGHIWRMIYFHSQPYQYLLLDLTLLSLLTKSFSKECFLGAQVLIPFHRLLKDSVSLCEDSLEI